MTTRSEQQQDCMQWLSISEETLFLHDGLMRVTELVELPHDVSTADQQLEQEVVSFDSKSPDELSERLRTICGTQNSANARLLEYRLNALRGFWAAIRSLAFEVQREKVAAREALSKKPCQKETETGSFSTQVSLLLVLPLLQSQSRLDNSLCGITTSLLLKCLRDCSPLSLRKEMSDCLDGLESLLSMWLGETTSSDHPVPSSFLDPIQQQNTASALVALACARGSLATFIHTIHLLQSLPDLGSLPVGEVVENLLRTEGGQGQLMALLCGHHVVSWGFDDLIYTSTSKSNQNIKNGAATASEKGGQSFELGRSMTCDGNFFYISNGFGKGVIKVGSGLHGTLRGYTYAKNADLPAGWLACNGNILLHRPQVEFDAETGATKLVNVIDKSTLELVKTVAKPTDFLSSVGSLTITVNLLSDGAQFFWFWTNSDKNSKIFMDVFTIHESEMTAAPVRGRVVLQKKEEAGSKVTGEPGSLRLRTFQPGNGVATAMIALTPGSDVQSVKKEEASGTSVGISLKILLKCPMFCDGNTLVLLTNPVGGNLGNSARTLFGSSSSVNNARVLAVNNCFRVVDGQFMSRIDLLDAPNSALSKMASIAGIGVCYDATNSVIWCCTNDYVDQFLNPGHQAIHHILRRLGLSKQQQQSVASKGAQLSCAEVIRSLLQHVGCMCLHELSSCTSSSLSCLSFICLSIDSLGCSSDKSNLCDVTFVCDIIERAVTNRDELVLTCCLILVEYLFQMNAEIRETLFGGEITQRLRKPHSKLTAIRGTSMKHQRADDGLRRMVDLKKMLHNAMLVFTDRELIWRSFDGYRDVDSAGDDCAAATLRQICQTLTCGLCILYKTPAERIQLLDKLICTDDKSPAYLYLRQLILTDFAHQLRNPLVMTNGEFQHLWLSDETISWVLKDAVAESFVLLRRVTTIERKELERILTSVPVASARLSYLLALQTSILKQLILRDGDAEEELGTPQHQQQGPVDGGSQTAAAGDIDKRESGHSVQHLQSLILSLSSKIFTAATQVLEVLLEACKSIIESHPTDVEFWLQGLERMTKATVLGHLVPLLITAMTSKRLQCLVFADRLMSQLVKLVILSSQSALMLKTSATLDSSDDTSDTEKRRGLNEEEEGFLTGLRIPAPWTSGKTIESVHPVRDNYRFRETVHIPGAKCLFMRFDPRCATQYDYDKLVLFAGPNTGCRKVGEYGGNTFGYGSRSVLGSGWPKDLIKVEGDTVTFSFEMRSGREHNTPDKALWGFLVTVKAQESSDEVAGGLPFVADLALGLSVLSCAMLHLLFQGPAFAPEEETCQPLLKSKLLQKCIWRRDEMEDLLSSLDPSSADGSSGGPEEGVDSTCRKGLPRIKLPSEMMHKLRNLSEKHPPQIRPSISEVIKPEILEEIVLSSAIRHLSLGDVVQNMAFHEQNATCEFRLLKEVMSELYKRLYAMLRQLQSIAELEHKWNSELDDLKQDLIQMNQVFFIDYHLVENKMKELAVLCFLKDVTFDPSNLEDVVSDLCDRMSSDLEKMSGESVGSVKKFPRTKAMMSGIMERLQLLLQVTILPEAPTGITRSTSSIVDAPRVVPNVMVRSDTDVLKCGIQHQRSCPGAVEMWADDSIIDIFTSKRPRHSLKKSGILMHQSLSGEEEDREKPAHVLLIDQLFSFIGSNPEKAVSCRSFLSVAHLRWKRGLTRTQALVYMKELLTAANQVGGATHLVAAVTTVLQHGPRVDELQCGGMVMQVREAFAETMLSVVQLAAEFPIACCNSIGLLCIIPYTRAEERCLVRSGLVHLLDKLCSLTNSRSGSEANGSDVQSVHQKVSAMAWAGFQVLSNRCVMWENDDGTLLDEFEHSGLARQVSTLLSNHLAHATDGRGNEAASNEALQEVLNLLNNLSRSKMGQAILSQPACVSKLLSLLLDQRPSPKLVLIILQLCRVSLPLMSVDECEKVELPAWGQDLVQTSHDVNKSVRIVSLLLAKLGDFLVPGSQTTISSHRESMDRSVGSRSSGGKQPFQDPDVQDGRLSVFIHKREEQSSHEVIQPLISVDTQLLRLPGGSNMEKVVRMDREMTKTGKAEATTEDASSSIRKATKWAQMGLVVSTGPPTDNASVSDNSSSSDKKKMASEVVCREKNVDLAKTDAVRPFISSHVANSMAAEVIALLHSLLAAAETQAADTWRVAMDKVISKTLDSLPDLLSSLDDITSPQSNKEQLMYSAKLINATLAAVGGFTEIIRPGCNVQIVGDGRLCGSATVSSLSEQTSLATVSLEPPTTEQFQPPRYSDSVQVPIARLKPPQNQRLPLSKMTITESMVSSVKSLLTPSSGSTSSPLFQQLPIYGMDASCIANQICRVVAEIKTRACKVLSFYLHETLFASAFIQNSSMCIENLKQLANECSTGERMPVTEMKCEKLRLLYIDCAKPPPPPSKTITKPVKEFCWNPSTTYPPVRSCLFSSGFTDVMFLGDPSSPNNLPRGTLVYTTQPVPHQTSSFYWEVEVVSFGDSQEDSAPIFSFGFMPAAEKKDGSWTNPVGSCLFHNNGRVVHYNGASLLQWRSVRLEITLNVGDVAGIGWERHGDTPPSQNQVARGLVYFTHNGQRLGPTVDEVAGSMWPVVHIQKKNMRIRANFGSSPFAYAEGRNGHNSADHIHDLVREIRDTFIALPFHISSDSDSEGPALLSTTTSEAATTPRTPPGPPCRTAAAPRALKEYNAELSSHYKLSMSYSNLTRSGPDGRTQQANIDDESDLEEKDDSEPTEDNYMLLVKAWEQKVFPVIRRRFRNEAERKDGLEQIKGALQLGMTDIARQTVEFLYEENGGMPRDLHLPTMEDIKDELAKFTIDRLHKGTVVVIKTLSQQTSSTGTILLPKFAVRSMLKTFGLMGVVLDIDQATELVEIETYLRSEGILVRYWYPLEMLERPAPGYRKSSFIVGRHKTLDISSIDIHKELLKTECLLSRMFCRSALLELISQCNSPAMASLCCSSSLGSAAASAALLQELDVKNLQLLSNDLLAPPESHGSIAVSALQTARSVERLCSLCSLSLADTFYEDASGRLKEELRVSIVRAANQGEDYVLELTNQICVCLQTAPEMFPCEEFPVSETKICTDVHFPAMSFLVVSCRADPKAIKKDTSLYKGPWGRVFVYRGHRIKKTGSSSKQEVVGYPRDIGSSGDPTDRYTPVIVPADLVHVRVGISPPPGMIVMIHGLPPQLLLAIAYIETLVSCQFRFQFTKMDYDSGSVLLGRDDESTKSNDARSGGSRGIDATPISSSILLRIIELLTGYLSRTDIPAPIKEIVFHLLAQTLRLVYQSEIGSSGVVPNLSPVLSGSKALFSQLQLEVCRLYEEETKLRQAEKQTWSRYSAYLQSLIELCLAVAEVTAPILSTHTSSTDTACSPSASSDMLSPDGKGSMTVLLASPSKRKKIKAKRERGSSTPKRGTSPRRTTSESDSPMSASPHTSASTGALMPSPVPSSSLSVSSLCTGSKPEEQLWFHRALTMSQILRFLIRSDPVGHSVTMDAVADASVMLTDCTAHSRLLVISNIPATMNARSVRTSLHKAVASSGGLFMEDLYLPVEERPKTQTPVGPNAPQKETSPVSNKDGKGQPEIADTEYVKGYAVLQLHCKSKLESALKAITKMKVSILSEFLEPQDLADLPEDVFNVSTVNPMLFTTELGNPALESYLLDKIITSRATYDLCDSAVVALTEVFHSCFIVLEQRVSVSEEKHDSGYIYLTAEQIMMNASANLMFAFFVTTRPAKKSLQEHVTQVLKRYGVQKVTDKEETDKKSSKTYKKPLKTSKEKAVTGIGSKTSLADKKAKVRETPEKQLKESASPKTTTAVSRPSKEQLKDEENTLTLDRFLSFVSDKVREDVRVVWRALFACGFDLQLARCACIDRSQAQQMCSQWTPEMDTTLVQLVNHLCHRLTLCPFTLHPHEVYVEEAEANTVKYRLLQEVPVESIRLRFALIQSLNETLSTFFLPLVDLRPSLGRLLPHSIASLVSDARGLIFYDTKMEFVNQVLNSTALRKTDQPAPEVVLNPLDSIQLQYEPRPAMETYLSQALKQLASISSTQLCVPLAKGGDPMYAFNVRFVGEEVQGTSGSFRHFLWHVAKELEHGNLNVLIPSPSTLGYKNCGKYLLSSDPLTFSEEKILQFFGQLLGVAIRAGIPFGLDLGAVFWKNLVRVDLDPATDLKDADTVTYSYIKKIEMAESEEELVAVCNDQMPFFVYSSLEGDEVELVANGKKIQLSWENRQQYVDCIRSLRMTELRCIERMLAIKSGLASVVPLQLLMLMTPYDAEFKTCGLPEVNLEFLKVHTIYQVGLTESDHHIQFFWNVLESFSQEELCRFIKFACNQERIPQICPCQSHGPDAAHVPPYPMKIAPPDGSGENADSRYIRTETCMFMVKLPQYSTQELMRERLLYSIHYRDDPLSG